MANITQINVNGTTYDLKDNISGYTTAYDGTTTSDTKYDALFLETLASGVDTVKVGLDMDLLWTNSAPTSSFSAQTIPLNLSDYDILFICHYSDYAQNPRPQRVVNIVLKSYGYGMLVGGSTVCPRRNVVVTSTGVQFTDAIANGSTSNVYCVPQYIYGLK